MKYSVTTFRSMAVCIKVFERFIRDGNHLETGKPLKRFGGLRSREILANWLICVVVNFEQKSERMKLCTDPQGGDGILYDSTENKAWPTEHILVSRSNKTTDDAETLILKHITKKQEKGGPAYALGKTLVVFLNKAAGEWHPNKAARKLPKQIDFDGIWVVGLNDNNGDEYNYNVTRLYPSGCPVWQVHINKTFDLWEIKRIQ